MKVKRRVDTNHLRGIDATVYASDGEAHCNPVRMDDLEINNWRDIGSVLIFVTKASPDFPIDLVSS